MLTRWVYPDETSLWDTTSDFPDPEPDKTRLFWVALVTGRAATGMSLKI